MDLKKNLACLVLLISGPLFPNPNVPQDSEIAACDKDCLKELEMQQMCQKKHPDPLQGEILPCGYNGGFNAPASIDLQKGSGNRFFFDASFTYWYAGEEGLAIASNGVFESGILYFAQDSTTVFQSFDYKPGFKVGMGCVLDHQWVLRGGYTWFHGTNNTQSGAPPASASNTAGVLTSTAASGTPVWVVNDWFFQQTAAGQAIPGSSVSSSWTLGMDLIDLTAGRPFYSSPRLTVSPYAGIRAAWIRQSMTVLLTEAPGAFTSLAPQPIGSRNTSHSWGIGPRLGVETDLLLGVGFRLQGDLAASLLYTQYTSVKHREDPASSSFNPGPYDSSYTNYGCLRPIAELGLGFGWGTYFCNAKKHFDMSVDYDFGYFWNQNMIRKLLDDTLTGTSPASADLYTQGATLTARFDF